MNRSLRDFDVVITGDGSPSLRIRDLAGYEEKMHHAAGALSETVYIYGEALSMALERRWELRVLSLGLGLGYNEMLVAGESVRRGLPSTRLFSFESEPVLAANFQGWLREEDIAFGNLYTDIANGLEKHFELRTGELRLWLRSALEAGQWEIRGRFPQSTHGIDEISCVLYDAFSNKMCPELWSEDVIAHTTQLCSQQCVFATYAVTGNLKRALKANGFKHLPRRGFAGKRESTFAIRGDET